jgi:hypothetical protein
MRPFSRWSAWLCLLLILWSAAVVAVHHHANGAEADHCTVCMAFHSAAPTPPTVLPRTVFVAVSPVAIAPVAAAKQRLAIFALAVRPPPQA